MSSDLIDRLRKARSVEIKVGQATFTATRYTAEQYATYNRDDTTLAEVCRRHVTGWAGVTEADIVADGDRKKTVPFDADLFAEVIADRADWSSAIFKKMGAAYAEHLTRCQEEVKK